MNVVAKTLCACACACAALPAGAAPLVAAAGAHFCGGFGEKPYLVESIPVSGAPDPWSFRGRPSPAAPADDPEDRGRRMAFAAAQAGSDADPMQVGRLARAAGEAAAARGKTCENAGKAAAWRFRHADGSARRMEVSRSPAEDMHLPPAAARLEVWCAPGALGTRPDGSLKLKPTALEPQLDVSKACGGRPAARADVVFVHADGGWFVDSRTSAEHEAAVGALLDRTRAGWLRPADASGRDPITETMAAEPSGR